MKKIIGLLFLFCINTANSMDVIKPLELPDQFGVQTAIDENTKWIVFTGDKETAEKVKKALEEVQLTDLKAIGGIYVTDISKMPSLITKMFAVPKMKKYTFKLVLDRIGDATTGWPKEANKASLITIEKLAIKSSQLTNDPEEIKKFLLSKKP